MSERNLYEVTGDIKDINTLLVPRAQLEAMAGEQKPVAWMFNRVGSESNPFFMKAGQDADYLRVGRPPLLGPSSAYVNWTPLYAAPAAQQPSKATLEKLRAWETNGELIDRAWRVLQSQEQEIMRLEKMLAEGRAQQPQAEAVGVVRYTSTLRAVADWYGEPPAPDTKLYAAPQQAEAVPSDVFLTDVMTAAGLVSHGKQCKALGERLMRDVAQLRAAIAQQKGGA